jgi:hypothetical protein
MNNNTTPQDELDVAGLLATLAPDELPTTGDVAVARERLERRRTTSVARLTPPEPVALRRVSTPWRVAAGSMAAAFVVALVVAFTPQGGSAAAAFLAQFRSQRVAAIAVTPESQADILRTINSLTNLGTVQVPGVVTAANPAQTARTELARTQTVSAAEAARTVGFPLLTPDPAKLPTGIENTPTIRVTPASQIRFTFDKNKARAYFQSTGHPEVNLPDRFDGATLNVSIPAAAVLEYGGSSNRDGLIIAEAGELVVDVQGNVSLPELRDFLLSLPGLPSTVVSQLKQIQNWNETLPIPVPVDQVNWQTTTLNGSQGLLLNDNSGVGSAAVWHSNDHLFGIAGTLKAKDLKPIADSMVVR